jgi:hypothetical protein
MSSSSITSRIWRDAGPGEEGEGVSGGLQGEPRHGSHALKQLLLASAAKAARGCQKLAAAAGMATACGSQDWGRAPGLGAVPRAGAPRTLVKKLGLATMSASNTTMTSCLGIFGPFWLTGQ